MFQPLKFFVGKSNIWDKIDFEILVEPSIFKEKRFVRTMPKNSQEEKNYPKKLNLSEFFSIFFGNKKKSLGLNFSHQLKKITLGLNFSQQLTTTFLLYEFSFQFNLK